MIFLLAVLLADSSGPAPRDEGLQALRTFLRAHSGVEVEKLEVLNRERATAEGRRTQPESRETVPYGFLLHCRVGADDAREMILFRKGLKGDRSLGARLPKILFDVDWKVGGKEIENAPVTFRVALLGPGRSP